MAEKSTITELNLVWYSNGIQSTGPFGIQTTFDYSNTGILIPTMTILTCVEIMSLFKNFKEKR